MALAKTIGDYKAISLNVIQSSMEITDQFYSLLNDQQVHERINLIGKASQRSIEGKSDTFVLFEKFMG